MVVRIVSLVAVLFAATSSVSQSTTIFNIPPDPNVGDNQSIGTDTQLNLFDGGSIGFAFDVTNGGVVNISGGLVGDVFFARSGSTVNISGGLVGNNFNVLDSTLNISGGSVGRDFRAWNRSTVNITGGSFGDAFGANNGSVVNLFGTQFFLDDTDITDLFTLNVPLTISNRNVTLSGLLSDGSEFALDLNSVSVPGQDRFEPDTTLNVTLVSAPQPGDTFPLDGIVNITDLNSVRNHFGDGEILGPPVPGDTFPFDGVVDLGDLNRVRNFFGTTAETAAVPEPSTSTLATLMLLVASVWRKRP